MHKIKRLGCWIYTGLLFLTVISAQAEEMMDANEIVAKANLTAYYAGEDGRTEARMLIKDAQGREQKRQFTILRKDREEGGEQDFLVVFSRPADVRNTVFLVAKKPGSDDDRWLYLPGLDLVKRISAGDKRTSFVGAHYFYEDVSGRGVEEDTHQLLDSDGQYYVVENTPLDPSSVEFSRYNAWINKVTFLPEKIEYYDEGGEVYRRVEVLASTKIQGYTTVTKSRVSDLRSGGETLLEFRHQAYDLGMEQSLFTERSLRKPPREWLRRAK
ncbi:outer membrane lipoprotein-sorting protein [uncultured Neptuniibacter sp.]|uniref:outer membrane lipoprotein-sorting protein n=1 Tax=uncultured Neptuniibacter sp. TaxID=502143 RepID=UPI00263033ED|nr:outer membrane lipoprotein-sorting protein [uncultured Neptuniibacter sp.]